MAVPPECRTFLPRWLKAGSTTFPRSDDGGGVEEPSNDSLVALLIAEDKLAVGLGLACGEIEQANCPAAAEAAASRLRELLASIGEDIHVARCAPGFRAYEARLDAVAMTLKRIGDVIGINDPRQGPFLDRARVAAELGAAHGAAVAAISTAVLRRR